MEILSSLLGLLLISYTACVLDPEAFFWTSPLIPSQGKYKCVTRQKVKFTLETVFHIQVGRDKTHLIPFALYRHPTLFQQTEYILRITHVQTVSLVWHYSGIQQFSFLFILGTLTGKPQENQYSFLGPQDYRADTTGDPDQVLCNLDMVGTH